MSDVRHADVVVIGGGPAGSTAANLLAQKGSDVVLVERARHPRPNLGESVLPHFWKYADALGATADLEAAQFIRKAGALGIWAGQIFTYTLSDFGHTRSPLHVERDEFDQILLNVARRQGADVIEDVTVRRVLLDGARVIGVSCAANDSGDEFEIRCRYVVDASGQAAVIARQLRFREFDRDLRFLSVWGYFLNSDYVASTGVVHPFGHRRDDRPVTLQAGIGQWGWCWHIVQKEATSVGLVLAPEQQAAFKAAGGELEERFGTACRDVPCVGRLLRHATLIPGSVDAIRDFAYRPTQLAGEGWFVVGDAAAFVDPINSAGVLAAFYTGFLAAETILRSLARPAREASFREFYTEILRRRMAFFAIPARPPGHNSYPEDYPLALEAARVDSVAEQELIAAQSQLTGRAVNLAPMQAMDSRLRFGPTEKCRSLAEIVYLDAAEPVS